MSACIDIVIVNYNSTDYLFDCIQSIYRTLNGRAAHIFVEDNASTDGVHRICQAFPDVELNVNRFNIGFGAAANQGIRKGDSPFVVLINPDSVVEKSLFDEAIDFIEANPGIGIIGPRVLDSNGGIQGSARSFPTPLTALFGRQSLFTRLFPHNRVTQANLLAHQSDGITPMPVDWVSGACMLVRRSAIDQTGLFDERFFMYWEDADWCHRMKDMNWEVVYFPRATVLHYVGKSSNKLLVRSIFEFHKSVYLLFNKYYHGSLQILKPLVIMGLFFRFCFVTVSGKLSLVLSIRREQRRGIDKKSMTPTRIYKPISVLRMIARLNIGGPAIHVYLLTKKLDPEKFNSTLVTGRISPLEGDMNYLFGPNDPKPIRIPELQREISLIMDIQAFFRIFSILRQRSPDIVHTHTAKAGFSARFAVIIYNLLFKRHVKLVHTFHGNVFEGYFDPISSHLFVILERIIAYFTDIIVAISDSQKLDLMEKYRIAPKQKIRTIRLGFNLLPFVNAGDLRGIFREQIGVGKQTCLIGIIGRLVPIKNHRMFFEAVQLFIRCRSDQDIKVVVVGDGELRQDLERYCQWLGIDEYVIFCGWIRNILKVYADLDVLALTSKNEGTPVSIIEAMASGVPVLATNAGGVRDLLGKVKTTSADGRIRYCERGFLSRKNDPEGFSMALEALIKTPEWQLADQREKARRFAITTYSQDRLVRDIESLYTDLTTQPMAQEVAFNYVSSSV